MSHAEFARRAVTLPDVLSGYDRVVATVTGLFKYATQERFDDPTPCPEWDVRTLLCHLAFVNERYAAVAESDPNPPFHQSFYLDPILAFADWSARARAAFAVPGFGDTIVATPIGDQLGVLVVQHVVNELTAHSWDLARALHRPTDFLAGPAEQVLDSWREVYRQLGDPPRSAATIDVVKPVPDGASALDRLAGFLGRDVR